jgi:hypothetical protein
MADVANGSGSALTKGARITGDQRSSLGAAFGQRYAAGESIRSIAIDTGRSYGFVHGVLKESGASLRGRGGATRGPRRGTAEKIEGQVVADGGDSTASPVLTKAKAGVEKVVDKVEKAGKTKSAKDDKGKKKAEPKKSGKKGKKG